LAAKRHLAFNFGGDSRQVDTLQRDTVDEPNGPNASDALQQSQGFSLTYDGYNPCSRPVERRRNSMAANCINKCLLVKHRLRRVAEVEMGSDQKLLQNR